MEEKAYIDALGTVLGQNLELNADGNIVLSIDNDTLLMQWRPQLYAFQVQMAIGSPNLVGGAIFQKLLKANFLLYETGGASLSYSDEINMVFLEGMIYIQGLSTEEFIKQLEAFVQIADVWAEKLDNMNEEIQNEMAAKFEALEDSFMAENEPDPNSFVRV